MKKIYTIIALAAITALTTLTACKRSENEAPDNQGKRPQITVTTAPFADADLLAEKSPSRTQVAGRVGEITRLATKTITSTKAEHSTEEFRAGDQIGIYVHSAPAVEQGELNHTTNTPYITDDGTSWRPVYLLGGAFTAPKYYITAYYPYAEALVDALTVPHTVATDQSDAPTDATTGKLELSNFLIARGATLENATTIATAQLNFAHAMALFEIKIHLPIMVEGRELDFLETMLIKGTETRASINLATGGVTVQSASAATIKPRRVSGTGRPGILSIFEAIVVPQNIAEGAELLEIRCRMKDGSIESFDYSIPKQNWMAFKSGHRTSITLMPTAEVSFMGELPLLIDGLAHSAMALPIFVAKDLTWDLSVDNIDWLTISATAGGVYGKKLSGSSSTGAITNVYVKVDANSSQVMPRSGEMILRGYRADMSAVAPAVYLAVQNYYNFAGAGSVWAAAAGEGSSPVAPFNANQTWKAASVDDWVKLASSATYGQGSPAATYSHVGALLAGQLFLQADANNSAGARQSVVKFSSSYADGTNFSYTVNQAAPAVVLVPEAAVAVGKDAGVDADLFTVTAPVGVKWKILSLAAEGAGVKDMTLVTAPAVGAEQVGTGEAVAVKGTYSANTESATRFTNVVISFATHAAAQQKTVKVTQAAAALFESVNIGGTYWALSNAGTATWYNTAPLCPSPWRVPSKTDFENLIASGQMSQVTGISSGNYWSSTSNGADAAYGLYNGRIYGYYKTDNCNVRCCQDLPTTPQPPTADQIVEIGGLKWTTGNLVATDAANCKVGAPADGGLYFQFGSLLGWKGGATGDGTGVCTQTTNGKWFNNATSFNAANEIAVKPALFTTIGNIAGTWSNQTQNLYYFGYQTAPYSTGFTKLSGFPGFTAGTLAASGVGDACRYYLGGTWRLPTAEEYKTMCNNYGGGSAPGSANAAWTTSPSAGMNFNNNSTKLFIPASGYRNYSDGAIYNVGSSGNYWSESVDDGTNGYYLRFNSGGVHPQSAYYRRFGFPVRCVQDLPTTPQPPTADQIVEIGGLKWTTGNLVAAGGANCKVGAPADGGLYFQFGSLLGWKGGASGDGTGRPNKTNGQFYVGSSFNAATEIAVAPSVASATIAAIAGTWPNQSVNLYYFGLSSYATAYAKLRDFAGFTAGTLAASGVGDPCRYYLGGTWRTPTSEELLALRNASTVSYPGSWSNGSTTSYLQYVVSGKTMQFPASGYRHYSSGSIYNVGEDGNYWSESVYNATNGYYLGFGNGGVGPQGNNNRRLGFSVRCVQDLPPVDIDGTKWALTNAGTATWANTAPLCPSPWRVPSKTDFENLIASGKMSQVTGISSGHYWSSTTDPGNANGAYSLSNGGINNYGKTSNCNVRCCQ